MQIVGLLILPGSRAFDTAVATEIWGIQRPDFDRFEMRICSPGGVSLPMHPFGSIDATHDLSGLDDCDLVIATGRSDPHAEVPQDAINALQAAHARGAAVASLCSGAFTLAAAGLLRGRKATTHWTLLDGLVEVAPDSDIQGDVLYTEDGTVFTSAGVVGSLDLCLHLIRKDFGAQAATKLARRLVMPPARDGGQRQYVDASVPERPPASIASTVDWAMARLGEPIGIGDLAGHAGMSGRTFHRAFLAATGSTPGRWLSVQRIRLAQRLLETTPLTVARVAQRSGMGTASALTATGGLSAGQVSRFPRRPCR
ncbi:transcriptional regulator GlxA family with amidase domain [Kibdelosporangium banguiense]|uniref:Transcriptional regulator GlxA family with amidase domain n=1 Tax=Kibdelosporangium banguiense TaxID=1365924 RepID=A0ABS4TZG7_9PSEU|nr:helix-turn-helix domain-containing protein [Kibdelosporangium banguiense]MBP2329797.1 transcriptional regulator GlxA family with amidase domain [Kibdelosporangium banguiense]